MSEAEKGTPVTDYPPYNADGTPAVHPQRTAGHGLYYTQAQVFFAALLGRFIGGAYTVFCNKTYAGENVSIGRFVALNFAACILYGVTLVLITEPDVQRTFKFMVPVGYLCYAVLLARKYPVLAAADKNRQASWWRVLLIGIIGFTISAAMAGIGVILFSTIGFQINDGLN